MVVSSHEAANLRCFSPGDAVRIETRTGTVEGEVFLWYPRTEATSYCKPELKVRVAAEVHGRPYVWTVSALPQFTTLIAAGSQGESIMQAPWVTSWFPFLSTAATAREAPAYLKSLARYQKENPDASDRFAIVKVSCSDGEYRVAFRPDELQAIPSEEWIVLDTGLSGNVFYALERPDEVCCPHHVA